ncbi:activating signal cointegrator 1 complex subunit 2 isoform X2 [Impatiens glandulifera]|uniref:activating signal cointegrator 1 complex subunit 2 isoform X2 n=1 Tax=Impatiens glandulifera TaxID=253017 RepID=UPI001FB0D42E|nr:activating signal cointegrator 1 complex subunit 2 isoform X2 [Impatiens glandulifera]
MQEKKLLDLPKLFDICAIYGHENENLTQSLVANAIKAQPRIQDEFTAVITHFLDIVYTMYQRCTASLEVLLSSHGKEDGGSSHLSSDYLEVMDFLNDSIVSMDAFVSAYKPAAVIFSCPVELSYGNEDLLNTLTRLHDVLLPSLQKGFKVLSSREDVQEKHDAVLSLKMLSKRMVDLAWKLLSTCYLSGEVFDGCYNLPAITKMYPANVEDPMVRSDILVQTFREIGEGYPNVEEGQRRGTLLQNIEKHFKITERIQELQSAGWIVMEDTQIHYIFGLVNHPFSETNMKSMPIPTPTPTSSNPQINEEDTAIIESKISQIKDLFPDYGKGFLSACLEVYNQNPEEVIQRILDGTLHKDLQSLDTSLDTIHHPPPKSAPTTNRKDKGKGILVEPSDTHTSKSSSHTNGPSISSGSSAGRFVRKGFNSETLNTRDGRDLAKTAALASQLEYDDEYDDSFDDLGLGIVDSGFEEPESLPIQANPSDSKWNSRKTPQFYVKDGKNYSYKVSGSIAVANQNEAAIVNQAQKEMIHGLGQGGNIPLGAVKKLSEANEERQDEGSEVPEAGGRGSFRGRGGRGGRNHYRRDRAMKKHMSSVSGH